MLYSSIVYAETGNLNGLVNPTQLDIAPAENDIFIKMLEALFGSDAISMSGTSAYTPVTDVLVLWSSLVLAVGGVLITYSMLIGTMNTAHEGESLGKKWHSMWVPLRTALAIAVVLPLPATMANNNMGGLSAVQGGVILLTKTGVGIADTLWAKAVSSIEAKGMTDIPLNQGDALNFVDAAVKAQICLKVAEMDEAGSAMNNGLVDAKVVQKGSLIYPSSAIEGNTPLAVTSLVQMGSVDKHGGQKYGMCGKTVIELPAFDAAISTAVTRKVEAAVLKNSGLESQSDAVKQIYIANTQRMIGEVESRLAPIYSNAKVFADSIIAHQDDPDFQINYAAYKASYDNYLNIVRALTLTVGPQSIQANEIAKDGWASAGAYYWQLINLRESAVGFASNFLPKPIGAPDTAKLATAYSNAKIYPTELNAILDSSRESIINNTSPIVQTGQHQSMTVPAFELSSTSTDWDASLARFFSKSIAWLMFTPVDANVTNNNGHNMLNIYSKNTDPIIQARSLGNKMITIGGIIGTGYILSNAGIEAVDGAKGSVVGWLANKAGGGVIIGFLKGLVKALSPLMLSMMFLLFGMAFIFSTVIPMLPYGLFLFATMGYLIYVLEAMVAAPLWAVFHAAPDGSDELSTQRGSQGWLIAFSLVLRPGLIIIGFIGGMFISKISGTFLWNTFFQSFGDSQIGLVSIITSFFAVAVYGAMLSFIIYKSFDLCHELPNSVMQWIGGPSKDLGENSGGQKMVALGSTGSSRLEGAASQGALRQANSEGNKPSGAEPDGGDSEKGGGDTPKSGAESKQAQDAVSEKAAIPPPQKPS